VPEAEPIGLLAQQRLEVIEASRIAVYPVQFHKRFVQRQAYHRAVFDQRREAALDDLFFALPFAYVLRVGLRAQRQMA
jgi:hypothetical protein